MMPHCPKCGERYRTRKVPRGCRRWDSNMHCFNWQIPSCDCRVPLGTRFKDSIPVGSLAHLLT